MAADMNMVALVGRLTRDPEVRSLNSGNSVCSARLAFTSSRKGPDGWEDVSNFVDVTIWGAQGENVARFCGKGSKVGVSGRLSFREWTTQEGAKRSTVEVVANQVQFLDTKGDGDGGGGRAPAPDVDWSDDAPRQAPQAAGPSGTGEDDDIPF